MKEIIIAIIGSGAFSAIITSLISSIKQGCGLRAGIRWLLFDKINYLGNIYISDGHISSEDLRSLIEAHKIYHSLGGNGYLDRIMEGVKKLEIKE